MTLGLLFWLLFVLWIVFNAWSNYPFDRERRHLGSFILLAALLFVLGWAEFGFIIKG